MAFFQPKQPVGTKGATSTKAAPVTQDQLSEENLRERRYLWTARAFAMIFVVGLITNIMMLMALSSLSPLLRIQPFELTFADKKTQVVEIAPMALSESTVNSVIASMLRQYVKVRHEIVADQDEMAYNWGSGGLVDLLSTDNVFNEFQRGRSKILEDAVAARETRTVNFRSTSPLADKGYWMVDFDIIRRSPDRGKEEVVRNIATVQVVFQPTRVLWEQRLKNPIGFKVAVYGVQQKESFDQGEQQKIGVRGK